MSQEEILVFYDGEQIGLHAILKLLLWLFRRKEATYLSLSET
jgi:hypothetical protein